MLTVENVRLVLGDRTILDNITFEINSGEKAGLVGVNGAGKSSLLKIVAGLTLPDGGTVSAPASIGYLPQEPRVAFRPEQTTLDCFLESRGLLQLTHDLETTALEMGRAKPGSAELNQHLSRYGQAQHEWERRGGYEAESQTRRLLDGLGLARISLSQPFGKLSGGQKTRLALATLLFTRPDLLLLDEPTNHLDRSAAAWLMDFLSTFPGAVLLVSHDLILLDRAITRVLRIDEQTGRLDVYRGNYTRYVKQRDERRVLAEKQALLTGREVARLQLTADHLRAGTRATQAQSIDKRIARLKETVPQKMVEAKGPRLRSVDPPPTTRIVLEVTHLWKAYDQNIVLAGVNFVQERGQTVALLGPNGAGKTTLLRIVSGQLPADDGIVRLGQNVRIGYYAQEHEALDPSASVLDEARRSVESTPQPWLGDSLIRSFLGTFLFTGPRVFQQVATLSGGERTRLALAKLFLEKSNLLLLDEPTNNLDPASQEALLKVLQDYKGSVVIVCHLASFMERLAPDRALVLPNGDFTYWDPSLLAIESSTRRPGAKKGPIAVSATLAAPPTPLNGSANGANRRPVNQRAPLVANGRRR